MKKLRIYKLVQSVVLFLLGSGVCVTGMILRGEHALATLFFTIFFWLLLILTFVGILVDLRFVGQLEETTGQMRRTAYVDPLTGVLNHVGMDALIDRMEKNGSLPTTGCMVLRLGNLETTNHTAGRKAGDQLECRFGTLISSCVGEQGYVCRNSADVFLALIPLCDQPALDALGKTIDEKVAEHNATYGDLPIEYRHAAALQAVDLAPSVSGLISVAYQRTVRE